MTSVPGTDLSVGEIDGSTIEEVYEMLAGHPKELCCLPGTERLTIGGHGDGSVGGEVRHKALQAVRSCGRKFKTGLRSGNGDFEMDVVGFDKRVRD